MRIEKRFCGPPTSGNGGYVCGILADHLEGSAVVRLRLPPPLETELRVESADSDSDAVQLLAADTLVAEARPVDVSVDVPAEVPERPSFSEAVEAARGYAGFERHPFPGCFVCGPEREQGDGMCLFAGPLEGRAVVATPWQPEGSLCDEGGIVRPEFVWAALDCPGAFAFTYPEGGAILLGELAADIRGSVARDEQCVVIGWDLGQEGRKHFTGTALFGAGSEPVAIARATWIEVPSTT